MAVAPKPRWLFRVPCAADLRTFLAAAETDPSFSYAEVGATRDDTAAPSGYNLDHNRVRIGEGGEDFEAACAALRAWRMFPAPWTRIAPDNAPLAVGQVVAMQAHALGLWWINAARIVYTIDDRASHALDAGVVKRFGFAYGTLCAHVEQGEERFSVELRHDGGVWYDLRAFSRPRYWPVRHAKPLARRLQARFVRESQLGMSAAVAHRRNAMTDSRSKPPSAPITT